MCVRERFQFSQGANRHWFIQKRDEICKLSQSNLSGTFEDLSLSFPRRKGGKKKRPIWTRPLTSFWSFLSCDRHGFLSKQPKKKLNFFKKKSFSPNKRPEHILIFRRSRPKDQTHQPKIRPSCPSRSKGPYFLI